MSGTKQTHRGLYRLIVRLLPSEEGPAFADELAEHYENLVSERGRAAALLWLSMQIWDFFTAMLRRSTSRRSAMILNYIKIAVRNLRRHRAYSAVHLSGMALGLTIFFLLAMMVNYNYSYNTFHHDAHEVQALIQVNPDGNSGARHSGRTPLPMLAMLMDEFSEIASGTRWVPAGRISMKQDSRLFYENRARYVDANFLSFFDFKLLEGEKNSVLANPASVVLSEAMARKYFGDEKAVGQSLIMDGDRPLTVTGIVETVPVNSGLKYDCLISMETLDDRENWDKTGATFIRVDDNVAAQGLHAGLKRFLDSHYEESVEKPLDLYCFPMVDLFLFGEHIDGLWWQSEPNANYFLLTLGTLLLLVMCINFMNLSTARYTLRAKEIGLRKMVGAKESQLMLQFLSESVFLTLLAFPLALLMTAWTQWPFSQLVSTPEIPLNLSIWNYPGLIAKLFGVTVIVGLLAGAYPAFYLARLKLGQILLARGGRRKSRGRLRRALVLTQFVFSILLVVFALEATRHYSYLDSLDLGYSREGVTVIPITNETVKAKVDLLRRRLEADPHIAAVSAADYVPVNWYARSPAAPEGVADDVQWSMDSYGVGYEFFNTLNMKLTAGRGFDRAFDDGLNIVINRLAAERLGWEQPLGKRITWKDQVMTVVGVVEDVHFRNVHFPIIPTFFHLSPGTAQYVYIKMTGSVDESKAAIKSAWKEVLPDEPLETRTLQSYFSDAYAPMEKYGVLMGVISAIALVFSCFGVLGMATYALRQKVKEIGIRKVLGASVGHVVWRVLADFLKTVLLANILAAPITYYVVTWFFEFGWTYRMEMNPMIFVAIAGLTSTAAVISVIGQTVQAARVNPVQSLKCE